MLCSKCKLNLPDKAYFCWRCGQPLNSMTDGSFAHNETTQVSHESNIHAPRPSINPSSHSYQPQTSSNATHLMKHPLLRRKFLLGMAGLTLGGSRLIWLANHTNSPSVTNQSSPQSRQ